jgi:polysaccharide biosynthesis protein PslG
MRRRRSHSLLAAVLSLVFVTSAGAKGPGQQPPTNTAPPAITGNTVQGSMLTSSAGTWNGVGLGYRYQWVRCSSGGSCSNISGQTASTYTTAAADVGSTLRTVVTATNKNGSATATSAATAAVTAPIAPPPPPPPPPSPPAERFGIATGGAIQNLSAADLARYLDGVAAEHAGWLRFDINWDRIQANGPSSYDWAPFDAVVSAARSRGLNVLGTILYTPAWARPSGTGASTPPTNLNDYAAFAATAVAHFAPMGVHTYEVWNEPNIVNFWAPGPDPARYTQMLQLAYTVIRGADPSAFVVSAGLSPYGAYGQGDSQHLNPVSFLEQMYAHGAGGSFDAVGWHPYNYPYGLAYANWSAWSQMSQTTPSARSLMTANGDGAKQIWATEMGAPTGSASNEMSEAAQAQLVTDSYTQLGSWSWAGPAFFYSYRDQQTGSSNVEDNFGVIRSDWTLKPSYAAYQTAAATG